MPRQPDWMPRSESICRPYACPFFVPSISKAIGAETAGEVQVARQVLYQDLKVEKKVIDPMGSTTEPQQMSPTDHKPGARQQ